LPRGRFGLARRSRLLVKTVSELSFALHLVTTSRSKRFHIGLRKSIEKREHRMNKSSTLGKGMKMRSRVSTNIFELRSQFHVRIIFLGDKKTKKATRKILGSGSVSLASYFLIVLVLLLFLSNYSWLYGFLFFLLGS
jgi:hypothetical protein